MPDVTVAPAQIDATAQSSGLNGTGVCQPAYQAANGDLFQVETTQNGPPFLINVSRSIDNGVTWTLQDSAHAPVAWVGVAFQSFFRPTDGVNGVITIAYSTAAANTFRWARFDCSTRLFTDGVFPNLTDAPTNRGMPSMPFVVRSDGSVLAFYISNVPNLGFRTNVAGVWSARTIIANTALHTYLAQGVVLLAADVTRLIFQDSTNVPADIGNYYSVDIDSLNAVGASNLIAALVHSDVFNQGIVLGGITYIPLARGPLGTSSKATIFSSANGIAWTVTDLQVDVNFNTILSVSVTAQAGVPVFLWNFANIANTINGVYKSINFAATIVYYDLLTLPPNLAANNYVSQVSPMVLANGHLGATLSMLDLTGAFAAFFAFASGGITPPPPVRPARTCVAQA